MPGGTALVRTAIISGSGQLFLAKESDVVSGGGESFTVTAIFADSVVDSPRFAMARRGDSRSNKALGFTALGLWALPPIPTP